MFTTRLISGIVLVALAIVVVGQGGAPLFAVTVAISLVGLFELYRVLDSQKTVGPDRLSDRLSPTTESCGLRDSSTLP